MWRVLETVHGRSSKKHWDSGHILFEITECKLHNAREKTFGAVETKVWYFDANGSQPLSTDGINPQAKHLNRVSRGALGGEWEMGWQGFSIGENKEENKVRKVTRVNSASWNLSLNYFKKLAVIHSKKFKIERFKRVWKSVFLPDGVSVEWGW